MVRLLLFRNSKEFDDIYATLPDVSTVNEEDPYPDGIIPGQPGGKHHDCGFCVKIHTEQQTAILSQMKDDRMRLHKENKRLRGRLLETENRLKHLERFCKRNHIVVPAFPSRPACGKDVESVSSVESTVIVGTTSARRTSSEKDGIKLSHRSNESKEDSPVRLKSIMKISKWVSHTGSPDSTSPSTSPSTTPSSTPPRDTFGRSERSGRNRVRFLLDESSSKYTIEEPNTETDRHLRKIEKWKRRLEIARIREILNTRDDTDTGLHQLPDPDYNSYNNRSLDEVGAEEWVASMDSISTTRHQRKIDDSDVDDSLDNRRSCLQSFISRRNAERNFFATSDWIASATACKHDSVEGGDHCSEMLQRMSSSHSGKHRIGSDRTTTSRPPRRRFKQSELCEI